MFCGSVARGVSSRGWREEAEKGEKGEIVLNNVTTKRFPPRISPFLSLSLILFRAQNFLINRQERKRKRATECGGGKERNKCRTIQSRGVNLRFYAFLNGNPLSLLSSFVFPSLSGMVGQPMEPNQRCVPSSSSDEKRRPPLNGRGVS